MELKNRPYALEVLAMCHHDPVLLVARKKPFGVIAAFIGMSKYSNILGERSEDITQSRVFGVLRHDAQTL